MTDNKKLFPKFEQYVLETQLISKISASGALSAKLPRILGQGRSRTTGLDLPPSAFERKIELANTVFPDNIVFPNDVVDEIIFVKNDLRKEMDSLCNEEGSRRLMSAAIMRIKEMNEYADSTGLKNNCFFAGRFILSPDKKFENYSWSITKHYPIISKIPPDVEYLLQSFIYADTLIKSLICKPNEFEKYFELSWLMARHLSDTNKVYLTDVASMFKVACQEQRFWKSPERKNFKDVPDASFIANLLESKKQTNSSSTEKYRLIPAVLDQAFGENKKVFYLPLDAEGTQTRPYIYIEMN